MNDEKNKDIIDTSDHYRYGFKDEDISIFNTGQGLSEEVIRSISKIKNEPEWMLEYRLKAYHQFLALANPDWGCDLSELNFDELTYYIRPNEGVQNSWDDVPETIKNTFEKLKIPESEQKFLAGVTTQYESEAVYHNMLKEVEDKGVLFYDTDTALKKYPEIFKEYFGTIVDYTDNKYAALNSAVWSGGSFIYVPKGVKLDKPLQSYFRINSEAMGQFERTLIIVEDGADLHYVEGCTAPRYSKNSLHAAVVEIIVKDNAKCRYSTVQNWSANIINLVTKRAMVYENGIMEWIDGNIGSHITMKYPSCILKGDNSRGLCISIAIAAKNQIQDAGAKMIHIGKNTQSTIISKSLSRVGGAVNYRGIINHGANALNAKSRVECDTLILDDLSTSDTIPLNIVQNATSTIEHEATVSKISEEQIYYLMSRGLDESQAMEMIILGFIQPFTRELPMEYAVELNQLLKINMEGSVG
ncbi:MAG: Fe-S cluster assembly protein SufB [Erysipelotrichaceae bacterium]|nr:Fe-S cluster assembly protein SufB [Erysipelotrichaceae bacterium]